MSGLIGGLSTLLCIALVVLALLTVTSIRVVQEYERGVIFRLGRLVGAKGPGIFIIYPFIDKMTKIDLRVYTLDLPSQECITRDNVTVKVSAVVFYQVIDPARAVVAVDDYRRNIFQVGQTSLRSVLGQSELDELLAHRDVIDQQVQGILDLATEPWGVKITSVDIKDVELPQSMQRAMARQAEAERERRAKIISAEGEYSASQQLSEAARVLATQPGALQLRYLQTLVEIGVEHNSTIIFPVPVDILEGLSGLMKAYSANAASTNVPPPAPSNGGTGIPTIPPAAPADPGQGEG
ncbi:MAG: SPFH domain-containing protein [Anaerolineae bacterium]